MCYGCGMNTITLKNIPAAIHKEFKSRAMAHGRSLNKEIIATLEGAVRGMKVDATLIASHARAVRESAGVYLTEADLKTFKNAGRK